MIEDKGKALLPLLGLIWHKYQDQVIFIWDHDYIYIYNYVKLAFVNKKNAVPWYTIIQISKLTRKINRKWNTLPHTCKYIYCVSWRGLYDFLKKYYQTCITNKQFLIERKGQGTFASARPNLAQILRSSDRFSAEWLRSSVVSKSF